MSLDRLTALRLLSYCWLTVIMPPNAVPLNVVYNDDRSSSFQSSAFHPGGSSSSSGRKFGGYRIVPRACKDSTADAAHKNDVRSDGGGGGDRNGSGVCMFNYECAQMGGSVVGSCVDVFLFGACCRLPAGTKLPYAVDQHQTSTAAAAAAATALVRQPPSTTSSSAPMSYLHPVGDTILLHRNGTAVQNAYRPDDMSAELQMASRRTSLPPPSDWHPHNRWPTSPQPPAADWHHGRWPASPPTSKVDYADSSPVKQTSSSPVSKSTDSVPNVRKTTPSAAAAHHSTTTAKHDGYADDYYDGMVLVPTLTVHDPNAKTPVENNSIHHILSILNQTPPPPTTNVDGGSDEDDGDDPLDTSPSYQHAQHSSSTPSPSGLLYTWGSIDGDTKTPGYGPSSSASYPATRPASAAYYPQTQHYDRPGAAHYGSSTPATTTTTATSTHHLPGPHFHVTTAKPAAVDPIVPTVIVLSAANDKNPNKYSTTTAVYTSSYRPPPSHVKPSQSIIVTGKPSVSAAYTTTATYHHHQHHQNAQQHQQQQQQQQQNLAFVPVSSTTLADHYYNSNNYNVHHTASSSKPAVVTNYGHRPATTTTTTSLPPTLSSTVHHDGVGGGGGGGSNNNVFTTVITSVNHQYHKYQQPPTAATSTVARPVLNAGGSAAVIGGYRPPAQTTVVTDVDYPSPPVITPSPQVYITATDVHHQHHTQQQPPLATFDDDDGDVDDEVTVVTAFNSTDTFAFPPVRDPNVNLTAAAAAQQEKPIATVTAVDSGGGGGDYDSDADPHPELQADDNLDDKVHLFVEKVVQSLQGNFEDLERVLLSGDQSSSNVTVGMSDEQQTPSKRPTTTTRKPPRPGAGASKPPAASKPTKPPKTTTTTASGGTYRPTPVTLPLDAAPYLELTTTASRPTKIPALLTPVQLFQPTTYTARPPTKQPVRVTPSTTVVLDNLNVDHDHTTAEPDYRKVCGVRPLVRKNGRIVGGTGSTFGEWPWQVLVREATWLGLFTKNKCGGVLITQKHVITAAHCQPGFLANLVAVFGEYDISGEVESKRSVSKNVKRVIVHRQYDAATFENDIALLELESPVGYDQHIVPICMPDDDDDFTGRMASVTGWGRLKYGGGVPSILQEVQVPIIENQVCQDMFETAGHSKTILSSFLCAGYANGQRDSCEGDSGGPLMIEKDNGRWTLIGTVSHGIKCAAPYLPGVYMRTTYYKPWLQTITGVQ